MADRHSPTSPPPGRGAAGTDDSFSDEVIRTRSPSGVDGARLLDSDAKCIRTDVPERLDLLLPGEAALVYQHLRDRLATVFDRAGN